MEVPSQRPPLDGSLVFPHGNPPYEPPLRESPPPLNPQQEKVVLGYGDRAPEPQNPEEWSMHAGESMAAMAEVSQRLMSSRPRSDQYEVYEIQSAEAYGLCVRAGRDNFEVRIQPRVPQPEVPAGANLEEIIALIGPEAIEERQKQAPEFKWTSERAHQVAVQQHGTERLLHTFDPNEGLFPVVAEPEEVAQQAPTVAQHARFLRGAAIRFAASVGDREVLAKLLPQEAYE